MSDTLLPFGTPELLAAVSGASRVLDAACGSGRLTVALARTGAAVTAFDSSASALERAAERADAAGVRLELVTADLEAPLPFSDGSFDACTSRLALMIPRDPTATLREVARVLRPGGRVATALWATTDRNPWFAEPRSAVAEVLGDDRARFARAFGRLGTVEEAVRVHERAGLVEVMGAVLEESVARADAAEHWSLLAAENGHFRRVDESLAESERRLLLEALARRLERFRGPGASSALRLPRTLVLVTARTRS